MQSYSVQVEVSICDLPANSNGSASLRDSYVHAQIQKIPSGRETFFQSSTYFTEGPTDLPREAIGFSKGSVPVFLKKHIATCDLAGGV